jgi:hypothetical protein
MKEKRNNDIHIKVEGEIFIINNRLQSRMGSTDNVIVLYDADRIIGYRPLTYDMLIYSY